MTQKIDAGNPNNLAPCPTDQNARHHNCWGTHTDADGKYVGEWKDNKKNGQGSFIYNDGSKYVGEFKDGNLHGLGKWSNDGGDYVGEFKDGTFNGRGTFTWPDGKKYVGEWKDEDLGGRGIMYRADGLVEESGTYRNGKLTKSEYVDPSSFNVIK